VIDLSSTKDMAKRFSDPRSRAALAGLVASDAWGLLVNVLEEKASQCDEAVARFVRPDDSRSMEQIVIDNNRYVTIADSLRFVPRMVEAALKDFSKKGRE